MYSTGLKLYLDNLFKNENQEFIIGTMLDLHAELFATYDVFSNMIPPGYKRAVVYHFYYEEIKKLILRGDPDRFTTLTCKKGCAKCCHYPVFITDDEADLLVKLIKDYLYIDRRIPSFPKKSIISPYCQEEKTCRKSRACTATL